MRLRTVLLMIVMASSAFMSRTSAQMPVRLYATRPIAPDSADIAYYGREHFWRSAGEVVGFNIGLWAYDRYVEHGDWSYISLHTMGQNFKHGFKWDNDRLNTNMFLHPYNGNLYYNIARSNGYNYWKSGLFAIAGSAMWELFMECEYPSTNDIIATPIGGMCIGEICFRASDAFIDDRTCGMDRFGRELATFIVSPMRGLTRILTGNAWRHRSTPGKMFGTPNLAVELGAGAGVLDYRHDGNKVYVGGEMELNIEYGDRFEIKSFQPYDYFNVRASMQVMQRQPFLQHLEIKGRLLAREFLEENDIHLSLGLFQHFDFYDSDSIKGGGVPYKLGVPASVGTGVFFRDIERRKCVIDAYAHVNAVLLGAVLSDYYQVDDRNYNLANGFSLKSGANVNFNRGKWDISVSNEFYRLFTWKGYARNTDLSTVDYRTLNAMGDKSVASFCVTTVHTDLRLMPKTYLTLYLDHFLRSTHYRDYPHVKSSSLSARLMLTRKL